MIRGGAGPGVLFGFSPADQERKSNILEMDLNPRNWYICSYSSTFFVWIIYWYIFVCVHRRRWLTLKGRVGSTPKAMSLWCHGIATWRWPCAPGSGWGRPWSVGLVKREILKDGGSLAGSFCFEGTVFWCFHDFYCQLLGCSQCLRFLSFIRRYYLATIQTLQVIVFPGVVKGCETLCSRTIYVIFVSKVVRSLYPGGG